MAAKFYKRTKKKFFSLLADWEAIRLKQRMHSWQARCLPDFIIIGAQKAGTSSLFAYLSKHPQILPSSTKEVHYFDGGLVPMEDNYIKGEAWYRAHFPRRLLVLKQQRVFEASPLYLYNPLVAKRIAGLIPRVKLIALLRNPTERAISHYFHERRMGREPLDILPALQIEEERLAPALANQDYKNKAYVHLSYKARGIYHTQLARYFEHFPREQILVLSSEAFFNQPQETLRKVFEFVGVNPDHTVRNLKPRNVAKNRTRVDPEVVTYLDDFFRPHNQALFDMLGESFDWLG